MKRVLIITYYWPPTGGSGVQRWLKFCKYLPEFGWQPVVYTPENPDSGLTDDTLLSDIGDQIEVLKNKIKDPTAFISTKKKQGNRNDGYSKIEGTSRLFQLARWIRGNVFIPDSRILWVGSSVKFLTKYLANNPVDLIVTTGPPHSMHLIGMRLQDKHQLKWIMDLRDPMSQIITNQELYMSRLALKKYKRIESRLLQKADAVISTSPGMPSLLCDFNQKKYTTITNGYDGDDFDTFTKPSAKPFVITHAGLLNKYRIPEVLLAVLNELIEEDHEQWAMFELQLAGIISDQFFDVLEAYPNVKNRTRILGYLSHKQIIKQYNNSSLLLLLMNEGEEFAAGTIPGKLFEYFAARKPILSLGPRNSVFTPLFDRDDFSEHMSYGDKNKIKNYLIKLRKNIFDYNVETNKYPEFERRHLTEKLVKSFNELC